VPAPRFGGQERAHAAMMAALCQAVETKDHCTRGSQHSGSTQRAHKELPPKR
jgi:hypothetical protein